jgi:hypothetical protein
MMYNDWLRKAGAEVESHGRSLVCALLDLMLEFVRCYLFGDSSILLGFDTSYLQNLAEGFN